VLSFFRVERAFDKGRLPGDDPRSAQGDEVALVCIPNRERAMKMLRSKLYEYELEKKRAVSKKLEDSKLEINFGSQIRSYVLQPYRIAKDHRTKVEVGDVDKVLDGYLEPFLRGYLLAKRRGTATVAADDEMDI